MHNASLRRTSGTFQQSPVPTASQTQEHQAPPQTLEQWVDGCLYSLCQADKAREITTQREGRTLTRSVSFEVQVRALHDLANKASLDMETLTCGLKDLWAVLLKGNTLPQGSLQFSGAQTFIDRYREHFAPTDTMVKAQAIIERCNPSGPVVRIPFDV